MSGKKQYCVILHSTIVSYFSQDIENQETLEETDKSRQLLNHQYFYEIAHLIGEVHSIYILRTPKYQELPERSTNDLLFLNPPISCCNGTLVELISKYEALHHWQPDYL